MDSITLIAVASVVAVVLALTLAAVALVVKRRRTSKLRDKFGPEYERTLEESRGRRQAEAQLQDRAKRVEAFAIQPLGPGQREKYVAAWQRIQADFVDGPKAAVGQADHLLAEIMAARGYPVGAFEQRSADLSVDHPVVVQNYRSAHDIAVRRGRDEAGTEELRQAMIHYRTLFDELVGDPTPVPHAKAS